MIVWRESPIPLPVQETIIVSIHVNVAGNGKRWYNATGWCCYTYYGHSLSDELADCLCKAAKEHLPGHKIRTDFADGDPDFEAPFYLLKYTYTANLMLSKWSNMTSLK